MKKLKIIANRNGSWVEPSYVDETLDEWSCDFECNVVCVKFGYVVTDKYIQKIVGSFDENGIAELASKAVMRKK